MGKVTRLESSDGCVRSAGSFVRYGTGRVRGCWDEPGWRRQNKVSDVDVGPDHPVPFILTYAAPRFGLPQRVFGARTCLFGEPTGASRSKVIGDSSCARRGRTLGRRLWTCAGRKAASSGRVPSPVTNTSQPKRELEAKKRPEKRASASSWPERTCICHSPVDVKDTMITARGTQCCSIKSLTHAK